MANASIGLDIKGVDVLKEVDELFKSVRANTDSIASVWATVAKGATEAVTPFANINKSIEQSAQNTKQWATELGKVSQAQEKISKSHQEINKSSNSFSKNLGQARQHAGGIFRHIDNTFRMMRSMASGGGGAGSIGQMAGQMGMLLGAPGAIVGGALATAITAIGFSVKSAIDFRSQQATALGMGLNNPFTLDAYGNYMAKYTGGEQGTAQLFGQLANNQATLGGPEFQQNWARRFGVNIKRDEDPKKLFEDQLRAEMHMAKQVRPELWKTTAQAMGVGDLVDIQRLWRFKTSGDTEKQFNEELKNAKALEDKTKLDAETAKELNEGAKAWGALAANFKSMMDVFSANILKWGGKEAMAKFSDAVDEFRKWIKSGGLPKTINDIGSSAHTLAHPSTWRDLHIDPTTRKPEELVPNQWNPFKAILDYVFPEAHAGELTPEQLKIHKRWAGSKRGNLYGPDTTDEPGRDITVHGGDKAKLGPYNLFAAAKIPDNIQETRDFLSKLYDLATNSGLGLYVRMAKRKDGDDGGGGMGGSQGWAGARRGRGQPLGRNTLSGGSTSAGGLTLAASLNMPPEDRALLDVLALHESGKASYLSSDPDRGAAFQGSRYQFLGKTWADEIAKMGAAGGSKTDLSPEHQDKVALHLAKRLIGKRWEEAMKNPSILKGILGPTWHGVWNEETGSVFQKALEAEKARKLEEKKKDDSSPTPTPAAPTPPTKPGGKAPRGHFHIHDPNPDAKTSHTYPAPGEKSSFNEHQTPLAHRSPAQFVHVHVNNTTGSEVAINAWMAVPQPAYV